VIDWGSGVAIKDKPLLFLVRSSVRDEYRELFGHVRFGRSGLETGSLALKIMTFLAACTVGVGVLATLLTGLLVFRIARATGRLSIGFAEVDKGNFAYRARLRGKDQLGGLIAGFNTMVSHLQESVAARADKQALDRELETARLLQRRLLPPPDFALEGFDIAVDFRPPPRSAGTSTTSSWRTRTR
jgi:HAMP domain-containing protein